MKKQLKNGGVLLLALLIVAGLALPVLGAGTGNATGDDLRGTNTSDALAFTRYELACENNLDDSKNLKLRLDVALDNGRMSDLLYAMIGDGTIPEDPLGYPGDYADYLDSLAGTIPEISFWLQIKSGQPANLLNLTGYPNPDITDPGSGRTVASFDSVNTVGDTVTLKYVLKPAMYYVQDVVFGFDLMAQAANLNEVGKEGANISWDDAGVVTVNWPEPTVEDKDPSANYSVAKVEDPVYVAGSEVVNYKITYQATAPGNLIGKTLQDVLPDGLVYDTVTADYGAVTGADITPEKNQANDFSPTELTFTVPGMDTDPPITSATLYIKAILSPDEMRAHMGANSEYSKTFTNAAGVFRDPECTQQVAGSPGCDTTVTLAKTFDKNGAPSAHDNRVYDWEINVATYGWSSEMYIIDSVPSAVHDYILGSPLSFTGAGVSDTLPITDISGFGSGLVPYDQVTVEKASQWVNSNGGNAVYYTAGAESVLIIPYNTSYLGKEITIGYQTKIKDTAGAISGDVVNKAKLVWAQYRYGNGPGVWDDAFDFSIGKEYKPSGDVVLKKAAYDRDSKTITWTFDLNAFSTNLEKVVITDVFDKSSYDLNPVGGNLLLTNIGSGGGGNLSVASGTDNGSNNFYAVDTSDPDETTFTLVVRNIAAADRYTFELTADVVDEAFLSGNHSKYLLKNTAQIGAVAQGGQSLPQQEAKGNVEAANEVVKKAAKAGYSFTDHTVGWEVVLNKDQVDITDAKALDKLPTGTYLEPTDTITVTLNGVSRTETLAAFETGIQDPGWPNEVTIHYTSDTATNPDGFNQDSMTIVFTDGGPAGSNLLNLTCTLAFETHVADNYRRVTLINNNPVELVNRVEYVPDSKVGSTPVTASDTAKHTVKEPPLYKSVGAAFAGTAAPYEHATGHRWSMLVNRHQVDMGGAVVRDTMSTPAMELDPDSFSVKSHTINANGGAGSDIADVTSSLEELKVTYNGFSFKIPDGLKDTVLRVEFTTYLVDDCGKDEAKNVAAAKLADNIPYQSNTATASLNLNYSIDSYISLTTTPFIGITKHSATSDTSGDTFLPLEKAEFEVVEMVNSGGWQAKESTKTRSTISDGTSFFLFMRRGTVYQITETKAPAGYERDAVPKYFAFADGMSAIPSAINGQPVKVFDQSATRGEIALENRLLSVGGSRGAVLQVKKVTDEGLPMRDVTFTLEQVIAGTTVKFTGKTGADGIVTFDNLDPGQTYTLKETVPDLCDDAGVEDWTIETSFDAATQTFVVRAGEGGDTPGPVSGPITIQNRYHVGLVELRGYEEEGDRDEDRGEFEIFDGQGLRIGYFVWDSTLGRYVPSTKGDAGLAANSQGVPYIQRGGLLPGDYTYQLSNVPPGFRSDSRRHAITVPMPASANEVFRLEYLFVPGEDDSSDDLGTGEGGTSSSGGDSSSRLPESDPEGGSAGSDGAAGTTVSSPQTGDKAPAAALPAGIGALALGGIALLLAAKRRRVE